VDHPSGLQRPFVCVCLALACGSLIADSSGAEDVFRVGVDRVSLAWAPPDTGIVEGYAVVVSTNHGFDQLAAYVTEPRVTLVSAIGNQIVARVYAIGRTAPGEPLTVSLPSEPSPRITFLPAFTSSFRSFVLHCADCATLEVRTPGDAVQPLVFAVAPVPWQLVGIETFDIAGIGSLWHYPGNGAPVLVPFAFEGPTVSALGDASGRQALGVAEIDGDGVREILLRTPDGGRLEFWKVQGTRIASVGSIPVRSDWRFAKAADLDGDGISELWWQTHVPGLFEIWKVSLTKRRDVLARVATDVEGDLVEVADFDGDGVVDPLWRTETGRLAITRFRPGGGGDPGALEEVVTLPWVEGDADLLVRGAVDLDLVPGTEILVQDRSTGRVQAISPRGLSPPLRAVLFDVTQRSELVLIR
jgi:hypothetical protein